MTIEQLIDELSSVGAVTGLQAEVKAWHIGLGADAQASASAPAGQTAGAGLQPLEVLRTTGVSAGWEKHTQRATAIIRIA